MAREINRLSARKAAALKEPGLHADGSGLYLRVTPAGSRQWTLLFRWRGKRRELGLGGTDAVSLARAREKAFEARALIANGIDPISAKQARIGVPTFGEMADAYVLVRSAAVRSDKSVARLKRLLGPNGYAEPLRTKQVDQIDTDDVLSILAPIWTIKPETGAMTRGYLESVLNAAKARGFRSGENPARWKAHLDHLLPPRQRLKRGHHPAMPFADIPRFMARLRSYPAATAPGLELLILTAARTSEVLNATWGEFDLTRQIWVIPAARMKAEREHRVPLSPRAVEILTALGPGDSSAFILPGRKEGKPLSNMAFDMLMRRMGARPFTVHGMRSSFRDWIGKRTNFPREVAEAALAHTLGDASERSYRREDALEKRRKMMAAWSTYCARPEKSGPANPR